MRCAFPSSVRPSDGGGARARRPARRDASLGQGGSGGCKYRLHAVLAPPDPPVPGPHTSGLLRAALLRHGRDESFHRATWRHPDHAPSRHQDRRPSAAFPADPSLRITPLDSVRAVGSAPRVVPVHSSPHYSRRPCACAAARTMRSGSRGGATRGPASPQQTPSPGPAPWCTLSSRAAGNPCKLLPCPARGEGGGGRTDGRMGGGGRAGR
jgi:hypothetical protein